MPGRLDKLSIVLRGDLAGLARNLHTRDLYGGQCRRSFVFWQHSLGHLRFMLLRPFATLEAAQAFAAFRLFQPSAGLREQLIGELEAFRLV